MSHLSDDILFRYLRNECSKEEKAIVEEWYNVYGNSDINIEEFTKRLLSLDERVLSITASKGDKKRLIVWVSSAAAVLLLMMGIWFFTFHDPSQQQLYAPQNNNMMVYLDKNVNYDIGELNYNDTVKAQGYAFTKDKTGSIIYISSKKDWDTMATATYNTIKTSAGGTLRVALSDGSIIWLNANSELTYPAQFGGKSRLVVLKGEAYFEVAKLKDDAMQVPFFVKTDGRIIKVLGTKFNTNTYNNNYSVALLEGKIGIAIDSANQPDITSQPKYYLKAGDYFSNEHVIEEDEIDKYIDWKEGYFNFTGLNIQEIKTKLENWYGITIQLNDAFQNTTFFGQVRRDKSLNTVLDLLKEIGAINYKITNNKTIILTKPNNN